MVLRVLALVLGLLLAVPTPARSATIRVPGDQPTIQAGINAATHGDTVLVAPGTYAGQGNKNLNLHGKLIALRSEAGAVSTVIDCEGQGRALYFQTGESNATVVEGFTIQNGAVSGLFPDGWGGAILCVGASPTIADCIVKNNSATGEPGGFGGGIACYDSSPVIRGSEISGNLALGSTAYGGGMYSQTSSSPTIIACLFENNASSGYGGGLACRFGGSLRVDSSAFLGNSSGQGGGVSCETASSLQMDNCTLAGNSVTGWGGGIFFEGDSSSRFSNCEFLQNAAGFRGGGMFCGLYSSPTLNNCNFTGNSVPENRRGGGMDCEAASPTLVGCHFIDNSAGSGGGLAASSSSATLAGCVFEGNQGTAYDGRGGAVLSVGSSVRVDSCIFDGNTASVGGAVSCEGGGAPEFQNCAFLANYAGFGGGLHAAYTALAVSGCVIARNWASSTGGGVAADYASVLAVRSCTIYGNRAVLGAGLSAYPGSSVSVENTIIAFSPTGEAVYCYGSGAVMLRCCDVYANPGGDWVGCIADQLGVNGNIFAHPRFCDPTIDDFSLHAQSPCAPGNSPPGCGLIGALPVGCGVADVAFDDLPPAASHLVVSSNPARSVAEFVLKSAGPGVLDIFDSHGRLVERLTGSGGRWVWTPGTSVPAGVYFARVDGGGGGEAVKFVYLR